MIKLLLGFSVLLALFYIITPSPASVETSAGKPETLAQTYKNPAPTQEEAASAKSSGPLRQSDSEASPPAEVKVEYSLPYPGILPDNPLHFLKALRDRIILMLISDPIKEAEFNLLTSDKRIYAAQLLSDRGKDDLSVSTLSKSNNYFHNAISSISEAKKMGKRVDIVLHNMEKSIIKHQEVLSMMEKVLPKDFLGQLQVERKRMVEFEKSVDDLILK